MIVLFAFLHHVAAFTLVAMLAVELVLTRQELTPASIRKLLAIDSVLGAAAGTLLVVGLARVFFFEKGAAYYFSSPAFLTKLGLFVIAALLSILPTITFRQWSRAVKEGQTPAVAEKLNLVRRVIHLELAAVIGILLAAAIMARGGWI